MKKIYKLCDKTWVLSIIKYIRLMFKNKANKKVLTERAISDKNKSNKNK